MPADLTYQQLQTATAALAHDAQRSGEAIGQETADVLEAAQDTARVADQIAALGVCQATVSETQELARILGGLCAAAGGYAAAADTTAKTAAAAGAAARTTHGGINEAVARSPQHTRNAAWYRQE